MPGGPRIECRLCGVTIQSMEEHDPVKCGCGAISVDGGGVACKVTGRLCDMIMDGQEDK